MHTRLRLSVPPDSPPDLFLIEAGETTLNVPFLLLHHLHLHLLLSAAATWDAVIPPVWAPQTATRKCLIRPLW